MQMENTNHTKARSRIGCRLGIPPDNGHNVEKCLNILVYGLESRQIIEAKQFIRCGDGYFYAGLLDI